MIDYAPARRQVNAQDYPGKFMRRRREWKWDGSFNGSTAMGFYLAASRTRKTSR